MQSRPWARDFSPEDIRSESRRLLETEEHLKVFKGHLKNGSIPRLPEKPFKAPLIRDWNASIEARKPVGVTGDFLDTIFRAYMNEACDMLVEKDFLKDFRKVEQILKDRIACPMINPRWSASTDFHVCDENPKHQDPLPFMLTIAISNWRNSDIAVKRPGMSWRRGIHVALFLAEKDAEMLPLNSFLGMSRPKIIEDDKLDQDDQMAIERSWDAIKSFGEAVLSHPDFENKVLAEQDVCELSTSREDIRSFLVILPDRVTSGLVLIHSTSGIIGGISSVSPFICKDFRGQGFGRMLDEINHDNRLGLFRPTHYSRSGYETRRSFHQCRVLQALAEGRPVHPKNLETYREEIEALKQQEEPSP